MNRNINIRKASGETELFDLQKLKRSLQNAGANQADIENIGAEINDWVIEGITTRKIYARAFSLLNRKNNFHALRYKLKQALIELGPTGFPFEMLIGEIFSKWGYKTEVGQIIEGHCITHEMDVIATNKTEQILIECKYSKDQGHHVSIQVPLYVRSRVDDIILKRKNMPEFNGLYFSGGVVTNSRFSEDSTRYGKCSGLKLLGWDYPAGNGLKEIIEKEKVFPITILNFLSKKEKDQLLNLGFVTCNQIYNNLEVLKEFNIQGKKLSDLINELENTI